MASLTDPGEQSTNVVKNFLSLCTLSNHWQFSHLFSHTERQYLNYLISSISPDGLHLLDRLQRRRSLPYCRISHLEKRYERHFTHVSSSFHKAVEELRRFGFLILFNASFYTSNYLSQHLNAPCHELTSTDVHDPLWIFLALNVQEINSIVLALRGDIEDLWKKIRLRGGVFPKRDWIQKLHELFSTTRTLTGKHLKTLVISKVLEQHTDLVSLPLVVYRMFQKLDVLDTAFNLDPDVFSVAQSLMLTSDSLLTQCRHWLKRPHPSHFFVLERNTSSTFFPIRRHHNELTGETVTNQIFTSTKQFEKFERARFIHKVIEQEHSQKHYLEICSISFSLEAILYRFLLKKACALQWMTSTSAKVGLDTFFTCRQDAETFLTSLRHPILPRFTTGEGPQPYLSLAQAWIVALCLFTVTEAYDRCSNSDPSTVMRLIELLLETQLVTGLRIKLFNRLMIHSFYRLKQPGVALEAAIRAFREDFVKPYWNPLFFQIAERLKKVCRACFPKTICRKRSLRDQRIVQHSETFWLHYLPDSVHRDVQELLEQRRVYESKIARRILHRDAMTSCLEGTPRTHLARRAAYFNESNQLVSVEQYALEWYQRYLQPSGSTGEVTGFHDEGGVLLSLFGILMHDILFKHGDAHAFVFPTQNAPFDLFSDKFYAKRRISIDKRLHYISTLCEAHLFLETFLCAFQYSLKDIINVNWKSLDRLKERLSGRQWWENYAKHLPILWTTLHQQSSLLKCSTKQTSPCPFTLLAFQPSNIDDPSSPTVQQCFFLAILASGIGPGILSTVFKALCLNYAAMKSGFPDLLLWKTNPTPDTDRNELFPSVHVMFSEIKSANDRLSEKQRRWLAILTEAGAQVELCCIQNVVHRSRSKTSQLSSSESDCFRV